MISPYIIIRLLVACALMWSSLTGICASVSDDINSEELIALYGIVSDIKESGAQETMILTLVNGANTWDITFMGFDHLPERDRPVIVLVNCAPGKSLVAVSYNYP